MVASFKKIFDHKGYIAPIVNKAWDNFNVINKNSVNKVEDVYHFAVGHVFKNLNKKLIFEYRLNEVSRQMESSKFTSLDKNNFNFCDTLWSVVNNIRNLNSHYVHTFDEVGLNKIKKTETVTFLKEAFELSSIFAFINEQNQTLEEYINDENRDKKLVRFWKEKFFPNEEHQKAERAILDGYTKGQALDYLLFISVPNDFEWTIADTHPVFTIKAGSYLSFHAQLFLISIFLYKHEAEQLISKIKGFKKNDDIYNRKRNIFTFFSKKFSSRDADTEQKHLILFRDIVQYLNHYPTEWNEALRRETPVPAMTAQLERHIIKTEIYRAFPDYEGNPTFLYFAGKHFFGKKFLTYFPEAADEFTAKEKSDFLYEINASLALKDINSKTARLNHKARLTRTEEKEKDKLKKDKIKEEKKPNPVKEKLQKRIDDNMLFVSYGRNVDRFMEFAIRFLAEENYFGKDALFNMYKFYTSDEQDRYLREIKPVVSKKEYDNQSYHQGKLTEFLTYEKYLSKYPQWDDPFVIRDNAFQVKVCFDVNNFKIFSVQRSLLIYLLEDALFNYDNDKKKREDAGKRLLRDYFCEFKKDFDSGLQTLTVNETVTATEKTGLMKLFPKRLLHRYSPAVPNYVPEYGSVMDRILAETVDKEERYAALLAKARSEGREEDFLKYNKGKQFKLRFLKKAWHILYFKNIYLQRAGVAGHHKDFHITKEEFNDFCKWIFAFDEVPQYKTYLAGYFTAKHFFDNDAFKKLFTESDSLQSLYDNTKQAFEEFAKSAQQQIAPDKYRLENYEQFFKKAVVYINLSHFIEWLQAKSRLQKNAQGQLQYRSAENKQYLHEDFYYKDTLPVDEYKKHGKLFNKLKKAKLEDCLLYETALHYLGLKRNVISQARTHISEMLTQDIEFDIKKKDGEHLYKLMVPFNKIDSLARLVRKTEEQLQEFKSSFMENIVLYLAEVEDQKDIKTFYEKFRNSNILTFENLHILNNNVIKGAIKFTRVCMLLEMYFIVKHRIRVTHSNRIDIKGIKDTAGRAEVPKYACECYRKKAFHFGVPDKDFVKVLENTERMFLDNEIKPQQLQSWDDLQPLQKTICSQFMDMLHGSLYKREKSPHGSGSSEEGSERAKREMQAFREAYFRKMIVGK